MTGVKLKNNFGNCGLLLLTQATHATLDVLGLATTRQWRNQNFLGWCNKVWTPRRSFGGVCGGGGGLSTRFLLFMQRLTQPSVLLVQQKGECTRRLSCTRWTVFPQIETWLKCSIILGFVLFNAVIRITPERQTHQISIWCQAEPRRSWTCPEHYIRIFKCVIY